MFKNILYVMIIFIPSYQAFELIESPCPKSFVFEPTKSEEDRWFGIIKFKNKHDLKGIILELWFDKSVTQLGNYLGQISSTSDNTFFKIENEKKQFAANKDHNLEIFVVYDPYYDDPPPALMKIKINGREICPKTETEDAAITDAGSFTKMTVDSKECGKTIITTTPLVTRGQYAIEGKWPWHAALYLERNETMEYICGGTLITLNHILTAAHCTINAGRVVKPNQLEVILGKYGLFVDGNFEQKKRISKVIAHPHFNRTHFFNDIAILKLDGPVLYSNFVRTICLWTEHGSVNNLVNKIGTAVGWGRDHKGNDVTDLLMEVRMPVVSKTDCYDKKPEFYPLFLSDKNFCAGFGNGSSVCNGDSGGGLVFIKNGTSWPNAIWQIRGIVSHTIAKSDNICDPDYYVIFTDVAKYLDWINDNIE